MVPVNWAFSRANNFSENHPQFGARASHAPVRKTSKNIGFKGCQFIILPRTRTCLGPAMVKGKGCAYLYQTPHHEHICMGKCQYSSTHSYVYFQLKHCSLLRLIVPSGLDVQNLRHQASPRVSPRESTQRRKVELWARNVR
jgi:hypothetical protein